MKIQQVIQDNEYSFPYHYISKYQNGFSYFVLDGWGINYASTVEYLVRIIKRIRPKNVLDLGCGDGRLTRELSNVLKNSRVTGIDYNQKAILLAKALNPNCNFFKKDIIKENINEKYDMVILMEVLEHIEPKNMEKFISNVHKLLTPNGHLIITVPHKNKLVEKKHFQHFDSKTISKYFINKFSIKKIYYIETRNFISKIIYRILNNQYLLIRYQPIVNLIYKIWKNSVYFSRNENECTRMIIFMQRQA